MGSHLVVGASGFLGRTMLRQLGARGIGTYSSRPFATGLAFDATRQRLADIRTQLPNDLSHVFILYGIANPDLCARDPQGTKSVNVLSVTALAREAQEQGLTPVYISTDYVFDGTRGGRTEDEPMCPTTEYGRQKAESESWFRNQSGRFLVCRSSKIVSGETDTHSVLGQWINDIRQGRRLKCATDQIFSPAHVEDLSAALIELADTGQQGFFNVAGEQALSRYDLAAMLVDAVRCFVPHQEVDLQPILLSEVPFVEPRPLNTSLSVRKLQDTVSHRFRTMEQACSEIARGAFADEQG